MGQWVGRSPFPDHPRLISGSRRILSPSPELGGDGWELSSFTVAGEEDYSAWRKGGYTGVSHTIQLRLLSVGHSLSSTRP